MSSKTIDPYEALAMLKTHQPNFDLMDTVDSEQRDQQRERDLDEIAMLTRRVKEEYSDIDLGSGDMISIRTCLSETEEVKLGKLIDKWAKKDDKAAYEIVALITKNPLINVKWLRDNPDAFSVTDLLEVLFGMLEQRSNRHQETLDRVTRLTSFRHDKTRPDAGCVLPLHEGTGPEGVGRSPS